MPHDVFIYTKHPINGYPGSIISVGLDTIENTVQFHKEGICLIDEDFIPFQHIPYREMVKAVPDYTWERI